MDTAFFFEEKKHLFPENQSIYKIILSFIVLAFLDQLETTEIPRHGQQWSTIQGQLY